MKIVMLLWLIHFSVMTSIFTDGMDKAITPKKQALKEYVTSFIQKNDDVMKSKYS